MNDIERSLLGDAVLIIGLGTVAGAILGVAFGLASLAWAARSWR